MGNYGLTGLEVLSPDELTAVTELVDRAVRGEISALDMAAEAYVLGCVTGSLSKAERFFFEHAGLSYLTTEHPLMGFARHAKELAGAEAWARDTGMAFHWEIDSDADPSDTAMWECVAYTADGDPHQSLGSVDFGLDGVPWDAPYRRVVEAELAYQEQLGE